MDFNSESVCSSKEGLVSTLLIGNEVVHHRMETRMTGILRYVYQQKQLDTAYQGCKQQPYEHGSILVG